MFLFLYTYISIYDTFLKLLKNYTFSPQAIQKVWGQEWIQWFKGAGNSVYPDSVVQKNYHHLGVLLCFQCMLDFSVNIFLFLLQIMYKNIAVN